MCEVDAVAGLLDGPRAREAFVLCSSMDPPWSLRIADEAPLTVMAIQMKITHAKKTNIDHRNSRNG